MKKETMSSSSSSSQRQGNLRDPYFTEEMELDVVATFLRLNLPAYCLNRFSDKAIGICISAPNVQPYLNDKTIQELKDAGFAV